MRKSATKEQILNKICYGDNGAGAYWMTPDPEELKLCEEMEEMGLLIQVGKINPSVCNSSYTYVSNDEVGRRIAQGM